MVRRELYNDDDEVLSKLNPQRTSSDDYPSEKDRLNAHVEEMNVPKLMINDEIPKTLGTFKFDDALSETKFGKFNYFLIITSGMLLATVFVETAGISYVLPVSQCDIILTSQQKGAVNSIGFVGIIMSSHFWGFLADTSGRRKVMAPALFISFIFGTLSSFYVNFWMLIVMRFFTCFFVSAGSATVYAYIGEFHTDISRSRAIMAASVLFGLGTMCLPLLTWVVLNGTWSIRIEALNLTYKPWRLLIVVFALFDLICAICLWILPESPKFLLSIGKERKSLNVLKTMYRFNTGKSKNDFPINSLLQNSESIHKIDELPSKLNPVMKLFKTIWNQTAPLFSKQYLHSTLLASVLQFIIFFTMQGVYVWFPYILNSLNEFRNLNPNNSSTICNIMYAKEKEFILGGIEEQQEFKCQENFEIETYVTSIILEILYIVGFSAIGLIINTFGKIYILFITQIFCGICGLLCNWVTSPALAGYFYVILLANGIAVPVVNAATVDLYPTNLRAMAVCITLMFGRLGSVVGSNVVGFLLDINCETTFYISGGSLILAAFLGFLIPKPKENNNLASKDINEIF